MDCDINDLSHIRGNRDLSKDRIEIANACEETHLQPPLENKTLEDINNTTQMFMELAGKNFEHSHDGGRDVNDLLQLTNSSHGPLQASAIKSPPHNAHNTLVPRDSSREVA